MNEINEDKINELLQRGVKQQHLGLFEEAEKTHLQVLETLMQIDRVRAGIVLIDLGKNARSRNRLDDEISYNRRAIKLLENEKGDAVLQCAHAHYNCAIALYRKNNREGIDHSNKAYDLYEIFPYTSDVDLADVKILKTAVSIAFGGENFQKNY